MATPGGSRLTLTFEGVPVTVAAKLLSVIGMLFMGAVKRKLQEDLAQLKTEAERRAEAEVARLEPAHRREQDDRDDHSNDRANHLAHQLVADARLRPVERDQKRHAERHAAEGGIADPDLRVARRLAQHERLQRAEDFPGQYADHHGCQGNPEDRLVVGLLDRFPHGDLGERKERAEREPDQDVQQAPGQHREARELAAEDAGRQPRVDRKAERRDDARRLR